MNEARGPSSALPLAYYVFAHLGFGSALLTLVVDPSVSSGSFYHARMIALVHALTLAWITGSILGSFYIVAPLALRLELRVGRADWIAFVSFVAGVSGMVAHFWIDRYDGMAWSAGPVTLAILWVAMRGLRGLPGAIAPAGVKLHVALAFANILAAATAGMIIGTNRGRGFLTVSPLAALFAHAHLAAIGWALMMVVGLSYRLIPMILPAPMPSGATIALSAVLMETGLVALVTALVAFPTWTGGPALLIVAGLASFVVHVRKTAAHRLPRPPALPRRDWSTWQTHGAFLWLLVATAVGTALSFGVGAEYRLTLMWVYGVAGLTGFLAQIVTGMQGRLVPMYAWYRGFAASGAPPQTAANALPTPRFALPIFLCWTLGIPLLMYGLAGEHAITVQLGAALLLAGVIAGGWYIGWMLRATRDRRSPQPPLRARDDRAGRSRPSRS